MKTKVKISFPAIVVAVVVVFLIIVICCGLDISSGDFW